MRIVWQRMLDEAGVQTLCHLVAGEPILEDGRIRGVLADTKQGRARCWQRSSSRDRRRGRGCEGGRALRVGRPADGLVRMTLIFTLEGDR